MSKKITDFSGKKIGQLFVTGPTSTDVTSKYNCLCECGQTKQVSASALARGRNTSCNCLIIAEHGGRKKIVSLVGNRYGILEVLSLSEIRTTTHKRQYLCRCECGKEKVIIGASLLNGDSKSCGCLKEKHDANFGESRKTCLVGQRFGKLVVTKRLEQRPYEPARYLCLCDCQTEIVVWGNNLSGRQTKSCGCSTGAMIAAAKTKHGHCGINSTYRLWTNIKNRCSNPKSRNYKYYGGRGISIFPSWLSDYEAFYNYIGERPSPHYSLDRISPNKGYEPGNIRWATTEIQNRNKRSNIQITIDGHTKTLAEWSRVSGIRPETISKRLKRGLTPQEAVWQLIREVDPSTQKRPSGYHTWRHIIERCTNPKNISWKNYGGRGITISDSWRESFLTFISDMGHKPSSSHSIDRIDNNAGYCKENCRWATHKEQSMNKRTTMMLTLGDKTMSVMEWAAVSGIPYTKLLNRIRIGVDPSKLLDKGDLRSRRTYPADCTTKSRTV